MEKRAFIAIVLSMVVFLVWGFFFTEQKSPEPGPEAPKEAASQRPPAPESADTPVNLPAPDSGPAPQISADQPAKPARDITVRTDVYTAVLTENGGRLKSLTLSKYRTSPSPDSPPKEIVSVGDTRNWPLGVSFKRNTQVNLEHGLFEIQGDLDDIAISKAGEKKTLKMVFQDSQGFQVIKTFSFTGGSYLIDLEVELLNRSNQTFDDNLLLRLDSAPITNKDRYAGFSALVDNKLLEIKPEDVEEDIDDLNREPYILSWAGYSDQYFMASILPKDTDRTRIQAQSFEKKGVAIEFVNPPLVMTPQTQMKYQYSVFYGPKDLKVLQSMDNGLDRSIYLGWFDILSKPLLMFMTWLYGYVGNYGVVIIIVTVIIKALFWPLTAKSYKSMKGMQKLQPKILKLREKYKDDRQAMNAEMMQLYRTYKVNPLGGCLPMVIQIPVFIALYRLLDYSLELRHAPFWLWIDDLSAPDRLFNFGFHIPYMDPPTGIPVLTLLMGAGMFIQQKMTPTPGDPTQAKIMMLLPIFFTVIFINFPAGLVLYWLVNNILSIGQQTLINRRPS